MLKKPIIVTEETRSKNDGKVFKKIPTNCLVAGIECCTLPVLLKTHFNINIGDLLN